MGSGRARAAPGSAGLRARREVRPGRAGPGEGRQLRGTARPGGGGTGAGADRELRRGALGCAASRPRSHRREGVPAPGSRARGPGLLGGRRRGEAAWAPGAGRPFSRRAAGAGARGGRRAGAALPAGLCPGKCPGSSGSPGSGSGTPLRGGGAASALTCSSGSCLCSALEPAGVGAVCACRSPKKEIETSRLFLILFIFFRLLKGVCNFCLGVPHGFPNSFCKSQMIQCSLVCVHICI